MKSSAYVGACRMVDRDNEAKYPIRHLFSSLGSSLNPETYRSKDSDLFHIYHIRVHFQL